MAIKTFTILLSILLLLSAVYAEEKEGIAYLEEVVVTATRTEKDMEDAPGSVSVVTKEGIAQKNIQTVDQALDTTAGVFDKRGRGAGDNLAYISLRGIPGFQRNLIMLDGLALHDAYQGGVMYGGMAVEDAERIEVVKGPFSSLYGGYAMGGAVNIITRTPERREFIIKSGYGSGTDRGEGTDDLRKFYFSYGDKFKDKLGFFISYGHKAANGYPNDFNVQSGQPPAGITGWSLTTDNQGNPRYLIGDTGDNRWWDDHVTLKAVYEFSKTSKIVLSLMRIRYEYNYDKPHTYLEDPKGKPVVSYGRISESTFLRGSGGREQNIYNLLYETGISAATARISLGITDQGKYWYVRPDTSAAFSGGPGKVSETPSEAYNADIQFTVPAFNMHIITFGFAFRHGSANTKEYNLSDWKDEESRTNLAYNSKGKDRAYSVFFQDEILVVEKLVAYIGFRNDWWTTYDGYTNDIGRDGYPKKYGSRNASSFSPKVSVVFKPYEKTTLKTSAGKAFRPPTINELYRTWTFAAAGITYAGNPDLKPETSASWDISIKQNLWKGAEAGITYFENILEDLIYRKRITPSYQQLVNVGKAKIKGIELELQQQTGNGIMLFANFTYNDARIKENNAKPETEGKRLTDVPEKMLSFGGNLTKGMFSATLSGRYVGKVYMDDENKDSVNKVYGSYDPYFTVDAKATYEISKVAALSLSLDNIFNREYFYYYKSPGRTWFAELTMKF